MEHINAVGTAVFITFSGNCRKALRFYQSCFGGRLQFEILENDLQTFTELPVVSGSLISDRIIIYGSDLVHDEGRKTGNYISIFLHCNNSAARKKLINQLKLDKSNTTEEDGQKLIEITDAFDVRWVLGV